MNDPADDYRKLHKGIMSALHRHDAETDFWFGIMVARTCGWTWKQIACEMNDTSPRNLAARFRKIERKYNRKETK